MPPRRSKMAPRWCQDAPRRFQDPPKMLSKCVKMRPRHLKIGKSLNIEACGALRGSRRLKLGLSWREDGPKRRGGDAKTAQDAVKMLSRWLQDAMKTHSDVLRTAKCVRLKIFSKNLAKPQEFQCFLGGPQVFMEAKMPPRRSKMAPRWCQDAPRRFQDPAKTAQYGHKMLSK